MRIVSAASAGAHSSAPVARTIAAAPADVVGVVVGDDDPRDARGVEPVGAHQIEDPVGARTEARVDHHQFVAGIDQIHVAVESVVRLKL